MNQLINADYSQEAEAAADAFALRQIRENGLPPAALATFFRRLQAEGGEPTGILAHLASHPELGDRIAAAETAEPPENPRPLLSEEEWSRLRWICGF
jgi:predicted Zn-dependent protease